MKVLILTEGGAKIGLGHVSRCSALSEALIKMDSATSISIICDGDSLAESFLDNDSIDIVLDKWPQNAKKTLERAQDFDFVVIDSYVAEQDLYKKLSEALSGNILMIDDNKRIEYPDGIVLNPSVYAPALDYPVKDGVQYLLGKDYILLRKDFWNVSTKDIREKVEKVMITLGGADDATLVETLSEEMKGEFGFSVNIIDPSQGVVSAKNMIACAAESDICVSGAGQTLYELLRVGLPTIAVELAKNQRLNIVSLSEMSFIENGGSSEDDNLRDNVKNAVRHILDSSRREGISSSGREMVDGKGALRAAETIMKKVTDTPYLGSLKIRPAEERDCYDIWAWRNNPLVRKWSFFSNTIDYLSHKKWFNEKMKDTSEIMYVCENSDFYKIGQARFKLEGGEVYISANLNPGFIGRGIGTRVIEMATWEYFRTGDKMDVVRAKIKNNNIASKKVFKKAGYVCEKELEGYSIYVNKDER